MPANPAILIPAVEDLIAALEAMGKETGYRRDYRGVKRFIYDIPLEEDVEMPWVQVELDDAEEWRDEASDRMWWMQRVAIQAHLTGDALADGNYDMISPVIDFKADVHKALFTDRHRNTQYCNTHYLDAEIPQGWGTTELVGVTAVEVYGIEWWFQTGDMSVSV